MQSDCISGLMLPGICYSNKKFSDDNIQDMIVNI